MAKVMTMTQLIQNPTGPYSAYFARRDLTIRNLEERYRSLMQQRGSDLKLKQLRDKDDYYFFFKIPSETYEKLHYDVVIKFSPIVDQSKSDFSLNNYRVQLFSNSPNFVFTYAYVYNQDDMLIDFLKPKISEKALTEAPGIRNPIQSYGFEKSVYFALLYIKGNRLNVKSSGNWSQADKLNRKDLLKAVDGSEEKMRQNNRAKANAKAKKDDEKKQKRVANGSKTGYNGKVEGAARKSPKKAERKRNMTRDMSVRKSKPQKPATRRVANRKK
jgi:hypothetical protein